MSEKLADRCFWSSTQTGGEFDGFGYCFGFEMQEVFFATFGTDKHGKQLDVAIAVNVSSDQNLLLL